MPVTLDLSLPDISEDAPGRVGHPASSLTQDTPLAGQILITGGTPMFVAEVDSWWTSEYAWTSQATTQALLFDPATKTITEAGALNHARYGHVTVENHLGEMVVIGGFKSQESGSSAFTEVHTEVFDPQSGAFHQLSELTMTGTAHHAAARLGQQGVISCGGIDWSREAATECTIISTDRQQSTMSFPGRPALGPAMVTLPDDRILYTGGLDMTDQSFELFANELEATNEAWLFENGSWRAVGPLIHPRAWHTATALPDGRVLISGGVSRISDDGIGPANLYWGTAYDPGAAIVCAEMFDPDTATFVELSPCLETDTSGALPQPMLLAGSALDPVHGALIMGGIGRDGMGLSSVMLYRAKPD